MGAQEDLLAQSASLEADLADAVEAWKANKGDPEQAPFARFNLDAAQEALVKARQFWREVGCLAPEDHEGHRPSQDGRPVLGVRIVDNVEGN
jgi:hypothetical protein